MRSIFAITLLACTAVLQSAEPQLFKFPSHGYEISLKASMAIKQDGPFQKSESLESVGALGPDTEGVSKGYEMQVFIFIINSNTSETVEESAKALCQKIGFPQSASGIDINEGRMFHVEQALAGRPLNVGDIYARRIDSRRMLAVLTVARMPADSKNKSAAIAESKSMIESVAVNKI